ncbi:serine/threonine-protein kinase [Nostoc sp. CMAA1605]|uniref:serine/threonine-protein kinase n=1 Tax=Nostoc sp. CMAA1605 TaxID=2055159 RepID=UPI001F284640|nr:serine/threonine-protein kinase [Nostoc sp. CMAA1605]MCF4966736.1 serine/threonine protein kinase [Nostoc sp. CMAA1605]
MQVYCSKKHANSSSNRFCIHCGEPLALAAGQIVDNRYRVIRQLGQGGFGRTYLAEDTKKSNQTCVLKEFAPQVTEKQDLQKARELFEREANVLKKLNHTQIPMFHNSFQVTLGSKEFFFLVQDYIDGDNFDKLLEERQSQGKSFTEAEIINFLEKILPVLSYIHSQDVVHRDISPDNLIWRRSDNLPVLIDFGGVKQLPASQGFWFTQLAGNYTLLGKKGYAPEEQLRQGKVYKNSDLYSLAVTVLVLLTGKEPQKLYDSYQGIWRWGREINVSFKLEAVLKKMLAYKPSDRYQNADQILKDLPSPDVTKAPVTHLTKIKTMIVAPGRKAGAIVSKLHNKTQLASQKLPLPAWLRPFAVSFGGTAIVILTGAGTWAVVNSIIKGVSSIQPPQISLPQLPSLPNPIAQPVSGKDKVSLSQVLSRRQQLEVPEGFFIQTVDELFYAQKPELKGRSLTSKPEDAALRDEWATVGADLLNKIEQANLSTNARRQLGSYTERDYENWRRQARSGQLGNYTVNDLNRDTNQKFDKLFPGQERGKLNPNTLRQVWYAIASDQVSQARQSR